MDRALLENILNISRHMAQTRALTPLLDYVVDEAMGLVGAERGFVVLTNPDGSLDFRVKRCRDDRELKNVKDQVSKSILNKVIETGEPLLLRDAMTDSRFNHAESVANLKLRSIMCAPLISHGDTIGAIYVENRSIRGRFKEDDLPPFILFANQAAVCIENATLNDDLERRVADRTKELKQAILQVEESWAEAVEANRLRTVWFSNVTHDLRTLLSVVSGALMLLQMDQVGPLNERQSELITKALNAAEHTLSLINDLSDLSKIEAGGLTLYPETVNLAEFLENVYEVGRGLSWPETVTFELDISDELPNLEIDPVRIRQVLLNLISNAQKFTTAGQVTLYASQQADQNEVRIGVADSGEGIPADKVGQLFERFQQVDENPERQRLGSGLGLSICRDLVEMHGGRIWVESTSGIGSNFIFTLPLTPPAGATDNS